MSCFGHCKLRSRFVAFWSNCNDLCVMKRLFSKRFSLQPQQLSQKPAATAAPSSSIAHTTGLQPSYVLPPLPHPRPYDHIALLATQAGLLVFPHLPGGAHPEHHVRISWGRLLRVEELNSDEDSQGAAWAESVVTYGIIGILELFNGRSLGSLASYWMLNFIACSVLLTGYHSEVGCGTP